MSDLVTAFAVGVLLAIVVVFTSMMWNTPVDLRYCNYETPGSTIVDPGPGYRVCHYDDFDRFPLRGPWEAAGL